MGIIGWIVAVIVFFVAASAAYPATGMEGALLIGGFAALLSVAGISGRESERRQGASLNAPLPSTGSVLPVSGRRATSPPGELCPRCSEAIAGDALVCRYCGHEFEMSPRRSRDLVEEAIAPGERVICTYCGHAIAAGWTLVCDQCRMPQVGAAV